MGQNFERDNPDNAVVLKTEKKVGEYVRIKIADYIRSHKIAENTEKNPLKTFNPLTSHLYFKISYIYLKTFLNYYKENSEILKQKEEEATSSRNNRLMFNEKSDSSSTSNEFLNVKSESNEKESKRTPSSIILGNIQMGMN